MAIFIFYCHHISIHNKALKKLNSNSENQEILNEWNFLRDINLEKLENKNVMSFHLNNLIRKAVIIFSIIFLKNEFGLVIYLIF